MGTEDEIKDGETKWVKRRLPGIEYLAREKRIVILDKAVAGGHVRRYLLIGELIAHQGSIDPGQQEEGEPQEQRKGEDVSQNTNIA